MHKQPKNIQDSFKFFSKRSSVKTDAATKENSVPAGRNKQEHHLLYGYFKVFLRVCAEFSHLKKLCRLINLKIAVDRDPKKLLLNAIMLLCGAGDIITQVVLKKKKKKKRTRCFVVIVLFVTLLPPEL